MPWASKRRLIYLAIVGAIGTIFLVPIFILIFNRQPTCTDGKQNGTENGVDCGGICKRMCIEETLSTALIWSRSFEVSQGIYNAVAYIENPNSNAFIPRISYAFKLFDNNNLLIVERKGFTFISPNGVTPIFEGAIATGDRVPAKTFFEFNEVPRWYRFDQSEASLSMTNTVLSNENSLPRIESVLSSDSVTDLKDIDVVAIVYDVRSNAIAVSSTYVDLLPKRSSRNVVFTWPKPFTKELEVCATPVDVMLLLDTSGSMNDDVGFPPQPITDAKNAAKDFVSRLTEQDRAGLITFATNSSLKQRFTSKHELTKSAIQSLQILPEEETGSTNIGAGIKDAIDELNIQNKIAITEKENRLRKVIVLLTDGKANVPDNPGGEVYALEQAQIAKDNNLSIFTIGLGDKVNTDFLKKVASKKEDKITDQFYKATTSRDLSSIYKQISEAICERGPAVIEIIPRLNNTI